MRASLIGAVGKSANAVFAGRDPGIRRAQRSDDGVVFAGEKVQSAICGDAFCGFLGDARLETDSDEGNKSANDLLAEWRSALFGPSASLEGRLRGHFAIFFCDLEARRVALLTDRFGSFPIYYRGLGSGIAFADRADALFDDRPVISNQAIFDYLYFHCLPAPQTVHEEVRRLEPGRILRWEGGRLTEETYWGRRAKGAVYSNFDNAKEDFRRIIRDSVARECSDDLTGAFLSGGTDSSTVLGLLAEHSDEPVKSFSIGFDVPGYDEASYARLAAKHFGSEHREYYVTPDDLASRLPQVAANLEQPFGNSSLLPAMICAERAREDGVTRLLAGDGGDELFGGNTRYAKQKLFGLYDALPAWLCNELIEPATRANWVSRIPVWKKLKSYVDQASLGMPDRLQTYNMLEREGAAALLTQDWLAEVDTNYALGLQRDVWNNLAADNLVDKMIEFDWKFTLADNDLRKVRYAADLAGIEVGFPLLTDELTDFSLRLPPDWKVRGMRLRWFFKKALNDFLPPEIIRKKKHGFGLPFGSWALEHPGLGKLASESVQSLVSRGLLQESYVRRLFGERLPQFPSYFGELVWILMSLELWLQAHSPDWRADH